MARGLAWEWLCSVLVLCIWLPVWSWANHLACLWETHVGVVRLNPVRMHEVVLHVYCQANTEFADKVSKTSPSLSTFSVSQMVSMVGKNQKSFCITKFHKYICICAWTNDVTLQWLVLNLMLMAILAVGSAAAVSVAGSHSDVKKETETISNPCCQAKEGWGLEQTKA